ncbi:MAG TPA: bifunctional proline dehydrogenase/L-glutamate gamma-semialdehyde dehydrogenase PutA [Rhodocyclaceae bacterium]|nr:bifunctional proline dehydrogenase/L-glutamate gamma-semialdehyde dehydrogenase PutA [Rhodocyclaceae bacterium]
MKTASSGAPAAAPLRRAIALSCRRDEATCVADLAREMSEYRPDPAAVAARAHALVTTVRRERRHGSGVDHLMHEFSLSSQEGIALMCLAEALLRIPDPATADRLIRDKIGRGDWASHLGHSDSLFVNAATWGLMITGKLVATRSEQELAGALARLVAWSGEPVVRRGVEFAMELLGRQFVMAETIEAALVRSQNNEARGYTHSFDMLGEAALTTADAERYLEAYETAIHAIGRASAGRGVKDGPGISVKLSALHPRYVRAQRERVMAELLPRQKSLMALARDYNIGLNIDAEEADRLDLSLDLLEALAAAPELAGWEGMGFVAQAYQKRCPYVIDWLADLARRTGRRLMVRLVKGAYWDSEIKRAQVEGQAGYPVYTRKVHSDLAYLVCAQRLLEAGDAIYPQFATHNAHTLASVMEMARELGMEDYEFQCLHGMGEPLYDHVVGPARLGRRCRIYAPVGSHATLLPYLVRRLLENGANSSFVNRIVDEAVSIDELVRDPLDQVREEGGLPHPKISLPADLYGPGRRNSAGLDFADEDTLAFLANEWQRLRLTAWEAAPLVAGQAPRQAPAQPVINPTNGEDRVGTAVESSPEDIAAALAAADGFSREWHATPRARRADLLRRAADRLEAHRTELMNLCIREAGKTWGNALGEVREAVDFCRYYAQQVEAMADGHEATPPGPVACISPWNFPLAIFTGQVAAALAVGSPVLAKPAEQTPLIAALAVRLFHEAGIPAAALQFLPGRGETVGAALVADPRVRGVVFTGSTEVAQAIHRTLAARPEGQEARLIAETGGQNAMIVDSSALPEQVVQDVLVSGFDSAGQRCSALRVLCLQAEAADRILGLLKEAMAEWSVGDPRRLSTDVGPVIDREAKAGLEAHIARMRAAGKRIFQRPLPAACAAGTFVPPTLIEIDSLAELSREVFGPVVHVLRYRADELPRLVDAINATGYGLTFGLHSRIDETVAAAVARIRAGNSYVNRSMIGAVVGVQPFGGEGRSGTGPKAGGPLYLHRLAGTENLLPEEIGLDSEDGDATAAATPPPPILAAFPAGAYYAARSLLPCRFRLPGPTGESNVLSFAPRGAVLCVAAREEDLLEQMAAALAAGNPILLAANGPGPALLARLPADLRERVALWQDDEEDGITAPLAAALFAGNPEAATQLARRLAARDGPLVPVLRPGPATGRYPVYRLVAERVLTVNTTAAGGNASLMALGG